MTASCSLAETKRLHPNVVLHSLPSGLSTVAMLANSPLPSALE